MRDALRKEELKKESGIYVHDEKEGKKDSAYYTFEDIQRLPYLNKKKNFQSTRKSVVDDAKDKQTFQTFQLMILLVLGVFLSFGSWGD